MNINKIKVTQFRNKNGRPVMNQFTIWTEDGLYFQSYDSIIAFLERGTNKVFLDEHYWDYSVTTGKYRNLFLGEYINTTRKKIESGEYTLTNLNKSE